MESDNGGSAMTTSSSCHDSSSSSSSSSSISSSSNNNNHQTSSSSSSSSSSDSVASQNIYENAGYDLQARRKLVYNTDIQPNANKPRDVEDVWRDIVDHFKEPFNKGSQPPDQLASTVVENLSNNIVPNNDSVTCSDALKEVLRSREHVSENSFSIQLFRTLRACLDDQKMIDTYQHSASKMNKCMDEPIVFTHGKFGNYAIGIAREINGKQELDTESCSCCKSSSVSQPIARD